MAQFIQPVGLIVKTSFASGFRQLATGYTELSDIQKNRLSEASSQKRRAISQINQTAFFQTIHDDGPLF
jgi:hypothetical protein